MKKIFLFMFLAFMTAKSNAQSYNPIFVNYPNAQKIELVRISNTPVEWGEPRDGEVPPRRLPGICPAIYIEGNAIIFDSVGFDLTLQLVNEDGEVVYSIFVPAGTETVEIPDTYTGEYELQLVTSGTFDFVGYVEL